MGGPRSACCYTTCCDLTGVNSQTGVNRTHSEHSLLTRGGVSAEDSPRRANSKRSRE